MKNSIFIIGIIALVACQPKVSDSSLSELNELQERLDSAKHELFSLDTAAAMQAAADYVEELEYIQYKMKDTLERDLAFFIDKYYQLRKPFKYIHSSLHSTNQELKVTEKQLVNLKNDAENNIYEQEKFDQYLELETQNVYTVISSSDKLVKGINAVMKPYQDMSPRIDSLLAASKAKNDLSL